MPNIRWEKASPKMTVHELVAPGTNGENMKLHQAIAKYLRAPFPTNDKKYKAITSMRQCAKYLGEDTMINGLTVGEIQAVTKKVGFSSFKTDVAKMILYLKTGKLEYAERTSGPSNQTPTHELDFRPAAVDILPSLIDPRMGGRFAPFKVDLKKYVLALPDDQIGIIQPSKQQKTDAAERTAFLTAMKKMFSDQNMGWEIKWSSIENVFVVARLADLNKVINRKKGEK